MFDNYIVCINIICCQGEDTGGTQVSFSMFLTDEHILFFRMPLLKDYGDKIAKWIQPPPEKFNQGWRWKTESKIRRKDN